jgi:hypothetical protein
MMKKNIPKKQTIPKEVQDEVQRLIDEFNHSELKESTSLLSAFFGKKISVAIWRAEGRDGCL